jgi:hypothetical protein
MEKITLKKEYLKLIKKEKELLDRILSDTNYEDLESDMNKELHYLESIENLRSKLILEKDSSIYNFDSNVYLDYLQLLSDEKYEEMTKYEIK